MARHAAPRWLGVAAVIGLAGACEGYDEQVVPGTAASFMTLEAWVALDQGVFDGFLRWVYLVDNPSETAEAREVCDTWERLTGVRDQSQLTADCPSCAEAYRVQTELVSTSCTDSLALGYDSREVVLGFAPIGSSTDEAVRGLGDEGFPYVVYSTWAPDGTRQPMDALFAASPLVWTGSGGTPGSETPTGLEGEFDLFSFYYWDLQ